MYLLLPYYLSCHHRSKDFYLCIHSSEKQKDKFYNKTIFPIMLLGEGQTKAQWF